MARRKLVSDEAILASYAATGSCKKASTELGICSQSVHERLVKLGASTPINVLTPADDDMILKLYNSYANIGKLDILAKAMGRTKQVLARRAGQLGLTVPTRGKGYLSTGISARSKKWHANNPHPKGMLGKTHSDATKDAMSKISSDRWKKMSEAQKDAQSQISADRWQQMSTAEKVGFFSLAKRSWKAAWRTVGGQTCFFRSRWEANYARYLEWLKQRGEILQWEHEPETFWFEKIRRGTRSFLIDFRITEKSGKIIYHEVKGWMDDKSITKIKRMALYYPEVILLVIDGPAYRALEKTMKPLIPDWETSKS